MDILSELWTAAKQAGPFASVLLLVLWWTEKEDRKSLQARYDALAERALNGLHDSSTAMRELREVFYRGERKG